MTALATDEAMGPAFDTGTLLRPTQRKLVCCWMELAGFKTLLLPRVWEELTLGAGSATRFRSSDAWKLLSTEPDLPFLFVHWTPALEDAAYELRYHFTEACFPRKSAEQILYDSDAVIVSQALALGTDMLVTSDVSTIDHYEVNLVVERQLGRNAGVVTTLDEALQHTHRGSDAGHSLLMLALTTIAPPQGQAWPADAAHRELGRLREALIGGALPITAARLETRWNQCDQLEDTLEQAQALANESRALEVERMRGGALSAQPGMFGASSEPSRTDHTSCG